MEILTTEAPGPSLDLDAGAASNPRAHVGDPQREGKLAEASPS